MTGETLGHYHILGKIGAGGMGEVYRATDTKLGREVALKMLPPEMARDPERLARFQREARAVAALNHPHIVTIFSVEEALGVHFLTMELVEGQSLDRLIPVGGLPVAQIIEIAGALAEALAAAHEKGIMHRDLKPANVMVTADGRVKVLDFGLAKDVRAQTSGDATMTSAGHTQAGIVMGTPAYMSPEQISGRALDHRTDIFSLGVLLHEMATGQRPFEGTSSAELISAILRDTPPSVTDLRADLPGDLARIIRRCLEKDPRHRVQTARDVVNEFRDLVRTTSQKALTQAPSSRAFRTADSGSARTEEGFWVAVLPFKYSGPNADLTALAEGMTEDIVTGLSRFSYLRVIARSSTARYASEAVDVRSAGKELGARYVMEGTLRQAGSKLRFAVQLVDAASGAHLWAETYLHSFDPEAIFELQDELVPRIVATVADTRGVLAQTMSEALRGKAPDQLSPYEALLRSFAYFQRVNPEEHGLARSALERAVHQAPGNADVWAILAILCREEYTHEFNMLPDPLGRAFAAARRAIEAAPSNHYAYHALASVLFFRRELQGFQSAAQRAITLNPMDGFNLAYLGMLTAYAGDWERGCALTERARGLNPHHPGWYWFAPLFDAYRKGDYRGALDFALKVNMPGFWRTQAALAAIYAQLGELEPARSAVRDLLAIRSDFAAVARAELGKWWQPELVEQMIEGLRKAGLEIGGQELAGPEGTAPAFAASHSSAQSASGASRADEGFWVAVLPFKSTAGSAELKSLADGLSEEIITGLSRFSYLRVIARGSTAKYSSDSADIRAIGKELGARYVMEGSLRQAGNKLRLAVQLVEATTGSDLWAENYERTFSREAVFALQDDLATRIVSTVADMNGVLPRSMSQDTCSRDPQQLSPYEAVLRSFAYFERVTPEDLRDARSALALAVQKAPGYADAWAMLALLHVQDFAQGFDLQADSLASGTAAAQRAVAAAPSNHLAHFSLAQALFFQKEFQSFRNVAARAIELNPLDGNSLALLGEFFTYAGDLERGLALAERAKQLNPNHPGWYWHTEFNHAYRQGDYRGALGFALKSNMPNDWGTQSLIAAAYGQLGEPEAAGKAVRELLKLRPDVGAKICREAEKWFDPEYGERLIDGLRKAGLQIVDRTKTSAAVKANDSGASRAEEGFWVAVLPFKYSGSNSELATLAEGLTGDVVTGLSRFSYLRVIARGSTAKYSSESGDIRAIGKELGARYVMEGSLRQAGTKLRLAVQLLDAVSGAHLWAENYERTFTPEHIFALQDDLVPRIVSTVADMNGVLARSMSAAVRSRNPGELSPYEAVLRSFGYFERLTPEELAAARSGLEIAVQKAPAYADAWAILALLHCQDHGQGFRLHADSLARALDAAQRAVEVGPSNPLAYWSLAQALAFHKEFQGLRNAAERAIALNPMDGNVIASIASLLYYLEPERGLELAGRAKRLNPHHPGWYWIVDCCNAYWQGDYRAAIDFALKANLPKNLGVRAMVAASYGQLGERDAASKALADLLKLRPDFAATMREDFTKWWQPKWAEPVIDGLRKAGLEIPEAPGTAPTP
jgi:TolB-like protein/tRNA A-37 threonylcarbamoyl transferase component Bud32